MSVYGVILFHTTSSALRAEKTLLKSGLVVKLIPTPREYSSDCGLALRFNWEQMQKVGDVLTTARVEIAGLQRME
jgi:hypothetical protein